MNTEVRKLSKKFGDFQALKSINLAIKPGEFIAVFGPSGCGKTTLLRLLAGFDSPTAGEIIMDSQVVGTANSVIPPEKRNIGMVFQSFALWPHMKVKEHVLFPLQHHKNVSPELNSRKDQRVAEVLKMVGLQHLAERMPNELSGGQKQRVAIARAIATQPSLLLMDEPLSSLDVELRMELRREIQDLHRLTKATIVYVTHDQGEALAMADRIVVMKEGQIEQVGTPKEIYESPQTEFVATFVGKANLVKGTWRQDCFQPYAADVQWPDGSFASVFREKQLYPVRPEQFHLAFEGDGIAGKIVNLQYQGKEIFYTVEVHRDTYTVHTGINPSFRLGDEVYLQVKD